MTPRLLPSAWTGSATAAEMPSLRTLWNVRATGSDAATGTCTTRPRAHLLDQRAADRNGRRSSGRLM
jgi:hypothetical protein